LSDYVIAILIGIIEGLTEFLPVSSSGHMILAGSVLGFEGEKASVFEVFIQLGAILSILILYRDKFRELLTSVHSKSKAGLTLYHIAAGILPILMMGFLFHKAIKTYLFSPSTVIIGLFFGGFLMLAAEKWSSRPQVNTLEDMTIKQAFTVGLFQILSLWPGFSRSGSTISGGIIMGMSRQAAAEFSFVIAVPLMFIACLYDLAKVWSQLEAGDLKMLVVGFGVAFVVAYGSVIWFLRFLNKSTLSSFAYYRFVLGAVSYYYFYLR